MVKLNRELRKPRAIIDKETRCKGLEGMSLVDVASVCLPSYICSDLPFLMGFCGYISLRLCLYLISLSLSLFVPLCLSLSLSLARNFHVHVTECVSPLHCASHHAHKRCLCLKHGQRLTCADTLGGSARARASASSSGLPSPKVMHNSLAHRCGPSQAPANLH